MLANYTNDSNEDFLGCCTGDEDCCSAVTSDDFSPTDFTSTELQLGAGTGDFAITTNFTTISCDKCLFCGCNSVQTITLESGQHIHLCQKHLDEIKNALGNVIHHHHYPEPQPWTIPQMPPQPWYPQEPYYTTPVVTYDHYERQGQYCIIDYHLASLCE